MAHNAFLIQKNQDELLTEINDDYILAAASYQIPIFWLALFSSENLKMIKAETEEKKTIECPNLIIGVKAGVENLMARKKKIFKVIDKKYLYLYDNFLMFLNLCDKECLQLYIKEIFIESDSRETFEDDLGIALNAYETMDTDEWNLVFEKMAGINWDSETLDFPDTEPFYIVSSLCGYGFKNKVPWEA